MKWLNDWENWLGNKPWYFQVLIGLVILPIILILIAIAYIMVKAGWDFLWNIIESIVFILILGFIIWGIIRVIKAIKSK